MRTSYIAPLTQGLAVLTRAKCAVGRRLAGFGIVCMALILSGAPVSNQRIRTRIADGETVVLHGNTRPAVERGLVRDEGRVAPSLMLPRIFLSFTMSSAQQGELDELLKSQQDRRSPQYHRFLTPEQYAARFGMDDGDIQQVVTWLETSGFRDVEVARSKTWVSFGGTAAQAEMAFHVQLHRYSRNGEVHFGNTADPELPKALSGIAQGIRGLHDFAMKARVRRATPKFTSDNWTHYVAPDDWETIYDVKPLYAAGLDGTGVMIAVAGQSDVEMSDIQAFRAAAGLPAKNISVVVPPGDVDPGFQLTSGDEMESDLDLEWSGAIAKNADLVFVTASATSGNGVVDAMTYAVDKNIAPILSISYGECEANNSSTDIQAAESLFEQANAQGMTILAPSGDNGAADCDDFSIDGGQTQGLAVDYPASSKYVTGVGGTAFNDYGGTYWTTTNTNNSNNGSALSYIPEQAWNDADEDGSGGGASKLFAKPGWQTGIGVPADGARDVPDLALAASPENIPLLICAQGGCVNGFTDAAGDIDYAVGGTSAGPPTLAGVLALAIQQNGTGARLGNINPNLYSLGAISANAFHDITAGSNLRRCNFGTPDCSNTGELGYVAGVGYDQATGWGSLDAYNFVEQWYGDVQVAVDPGSVTIQRGSSATATVTVTPHSNFSGHVTLTCSVPDSIYAVSCTLPSTPIDTSGTATLTVTVAPLPASSRVTLPPVPRSGPRTLQVIGVGLLLALALIVYSSRYPSLQRPSAYAGSCVLLLGIAIGAASCGGAGGAASGVGAATTFTPAPLTLKCVLQPDAQMDSPYDASCAASGGTSPVIYTVSAGTLPPGLILEGATGELHGTPTTAGTYSFTATATDGGSPPQKSSFVATNFVVAPTALVFNECDYMMSVKKAFSDSTCMAHGGTPPYMYSIAAGKLAAGIVQNASTGILTGVATTAGNYSATGKVTDSGSPVQSATATISMNVYDAGAVLLVCPESSGAQLDTAAVISCSGFGGNIPYTFSIGSGALPPGLTVDQSQGQILGKPTAMGTFKFSVQLVDGSTPPQKTSAASTIVVGPPPAQSGYVTITATSGSIVNTTTLYVSVPQVNVP